MQISLFGLGYVGCVSAARFAEAGHDVVGVDVNADKVGMINSGVSPIVEPGLGELLAAGVKAGRLRATTSTREGLDASVIGLICIGTPGRRNGQLDVEGLRRLCREIGAALKDRPTRFTLVVRSTVLPGTTEGILMPELLAGAGGVFRSDIHVAVNPEFIREGSALKDFEHPPFTLVGCREPDSAELLRELYASVEAPFTQTSIRTAEMVKYAANAFHAMKICFSNEIANVCDALGADAQEVMRVFRQDRKLNVSEAYLRPGFAFGGSCLPKDVRALLHAAHETDVPVPLLGAVLPSNELQIRRALEEVLATGKRRVGVVGLSFKPGTDDLRESPMVTLVEALIGKGCDVRILDHNVSVARLVGANRRYIEEEIPHVSSLMCKEARELLSHAEVLVIGNAGEEMERVMGMADPRQVVIDLTRGVARGRMAALHEVETVCQSSQPEPLPQSALSFSPLPRS